jgi:hypothetical protein
MLKRNTVNNGKFAATNLAARAFEPPVLWQPLVHQKYSNPRHIIIRFTGFRL